MNILVIGSGGREHAIIQKLRENHRVSTLYCAPGNGGIAQHAICVDIKATDIPAVVAFAREKTIDLVVVTPDDPLVLGMVDALEREGIRAFGPSKAAAQLEGSKVFAKEFMDEMHIPTAAYRVFKNSREAKSFVAQNSQYPIVVKADGLALGKGVLICEDMSAALAAIDSIMEDKIFGDSGNRIIIEQFITGPEVSVLAFTDGKTLAPMVSSMDFKRALDGNKGLNTGGMGTIAPNPFYTPEVEKQCWDRIFTPTIEGMQKRGIPFRGCLYFGLMITGNGPYVIEYNCRFGDPETQVVLPLLESDLLEIMLSTIHGDLHRKQIRWKEGAAACVVVASGGYPGKYETGLPISGLDTLPDHCIAYHAGTKLTNGILYTAGGRVLGISSTGETLQEALDNAYAGVGKIDFHNKHYRTDIGQSALDRL